jgi:hypothetical protein
MGTANVRLMMITPMVDMIGKINNSLSAARTEAAALNNFQLFENFSNMVVSFFTH